MKFLIRMAWRVAVLSLWGGAVGVAASEPPSTRALYCHVGNRESHIGDRTFLSYTLDRLVVIFENYLASVPSSDRGSKVPFTRWLEARAALAHGAVDPAMFRLIDYYFLVADPDSQKKIIVLNEKIIFSRLAEKVPDVANEGFRFDKSADLRFSNQYLQKLAGSYRDHWRISGDLASLQQAVGTLGAVRDLYINHLVSAPYGSTIEESRYWSSLHFSTLYEISLSELALAQRNQALMTKTREGAEKFYGPIVRSALEHAATKDIDLFRFTVLPGLRAEVALHQVRANAMILSENPDIDPLVRDIRRLLSRIRAIDVDCLREDQFEANYLLIKLFDHFQGRKVESLGAYLEAKKQANILAAESPVHRCFSGDRSGSTGKVISEIFIKKITNESSSVIRLLVDELGLENQLKSEQFMRICSNGERPANAAKD